MKNSKTWLLRKEFDIILESLDESQIQEKTPDGWTDNVV